MRRPFRSSFTPTLKPSAIYNCIFIRFILLSILYPFWMVAFESTDEKCNKTNLLQPQNKKLHKNWILAIFNLLWSKRSGENFLFVRNRKAQLQFTFKVENGSNYLKLLNLRNFLFCEKLFMVFHFEMEKQRKFPEKDQKIAIFTTFFQSSTLNLL